MDIWLVAAAAGAGYIAQQWKDLMKDAQNLSDSSSGSSSFAKPKLSSMQQFQDKNCHLYKLGQRKNIGKDAYERQPVSQGVSTAEVSSFGFDGEKLVQMDNYEDCDILSQTCLSPRLLSNDYLGDFSECSCDLLLKPSTGEMGSCCNRRILRSKQTNGQIIKPLDSLESCLMAQLYKEHAEMEECMLNSLTSPSTPTVSPLVVTDGSRIISREIGQPVNVRARTGEGKLGKKIYSEGKGTVFGVPPLPNTGRKKEVKIRDLGGRLSSSSKMIYTKHTSSQGSSHGALLFRLGISVAIMSSFLSNKREVDKLNNLLKQTEDLVHDLQEELEMKDSLTVKELALEDYESQDSKKDTCNKETPLTFSSEQNFDESTKKDYKEDCDQKTQEEPMRKIEAELEAEFARLELNMNSSTLDGQFSDLVELDPDFVPHIAHGELRADMFGRQAGNQPCMDRDGSGSSTPQSINYAVSPLELTLRLHELLESRLEERVKELEIELQNSRKEVQYMESEHMKSL